MGMKRGINAEAVNDRFKLMMHRVIARRLASDPHLIAEARERLSCGPRALASNAEWREILNMPVGDVRRIITSRSDKMTRLRVSSPLRPPPEFTDVGLRRRMMGLARRGVEKRVLGSGHG